MAEKFSLKDHLFNAETIGQLADEFAAGIDGFDGARFASEALAGFAERELLERLDWMADCLEPQLAQTFPDMADQLEAAMPSPLDPSLSDDDFGHFIHAVPGILAVRHGLENHWDRALDLLYQATQRFSMEFYIRPFLNRWPDETLARLALWAEDDNYHVRRLVSEGTRPKLPWAKAVDVSHAQTLPLLDKLHADATRYVTRSVSNHMNDISKTQPELVLSQFAAWREKGAQNAKELDWMRRHSLRTLVKQGHSGAMEMLGYRSDVDVDVHLSDIASPVEIGGYLEFDVTLRTGAPENLLVDYLFWVTKANGDLAPKVFKLKMIKTKADVKSVLSKRHKLKADATTFTLRAGAARVEIQVNGKIVASQDFTLVEPTP